MPVAAADNDDTIEDPVEQMLKKTGCIELHYKVQDCIASTQDWRQCRTEVTAFKHCMTAYTDAQRAKYNKS